MLMNANLHTAGGNRMVPEHGDTPDRKMGINGIKKWEVML